MGRGRAPAWHERSGQQLARHHCDEGVGGLLLSAEGQLTGRVGATLAGHFTRSSAKGWKATNR